MSIDWINRSAQVGIVIGSKPHWGKGYGTDAMRIVLRFAFEKMNLHRVWLNVYDFNVAASSRTRNAASNAKACSANIDFLTASTTIRC